MAALVAPPELQSRLEAAARTMVERRGTVLFHRGDPPTGVYLIRRGSASLSLGPDAPRLLSRRVGPGCVLGVPASLSGKGYSLSAELLEDSDLGFVDRETFLDILRETPSLCFQVMDMLSDEISTMRSLIKPRLKERPLHPRRVN